MGGSSGLVNRCGSEYVGGRVVGVAGVGGSFGGVRGGVFGFE